MRILMVNWAPVRAGALFGGGANGYLHDLALALRARGHEVGAISSGLVHVPNNEGKQGVCSVRRTDDYHGIQCFDIVNSPVLAWSTHQFRHPKPEISSPALEAEFARFLQLWKPEVVHFHNIEAFTSMCPAIARTPMGGYAGATVVYSLHNYHTICPQVFLMHGGTTPCRDFDSGRRCATCYDAPHTHIVLEDRLRDSARAAKREDVFAPVRFDGVMSRLKWKPPAEIPLPDRAVESGSDLASREAPSMAPPSRDIRIAVVGGPLLNEITSEAPNTHPANDYGLRRQAMVRMLSECDRVLAVSEFVAAKFVSMGVPGDRVRAMPIGSRMPEVVARCGDMGGSAPISACRGAQGPSLSRPMRLAFLGYHNFYKGLHVVCAAMEMMPDWARQQIDLAVHAKDVAPILPWLRSLSRSMARVVIEDGYRYEDVPLILRGVDLGLVPSVWWDNGPQTVMEFLACKVPVLGSAVGGIPDFVTHGRNGLLVPGNDPKSLSDELLRLIDNPSILATLREGITPPKDMTTHAVEIEAEYLACRSERASTG